MEKIKINGQEYIKVRTLREEIRYLRREIPLFYNNYDEDHQGMVHLAYNDIIRALYREELAAAKTIEEHQAIIEMPGDFIVCRVLVEKKDRKFEFFKAWVDGGKAEITDSIKIAMWFDYESKAEEIRDALNEKNGGGWSVMDMSPEAAARTQKLLNAIFRDDEA